MAAVDVRRRALVLVAGVLGVLVLAATLAPPAGADPATPPTGAEPSRPAMPTRPATPRVPAQGVCDSIDGILPQLPNPLGLPEVDPIGGACETVADVGGGIADVGGGIFDFLQGASCFVDSLPMPLSAAAYSMLPVPGSGALALVELPWCDTGTREPRPTCAERDAAYQEAENERPNLGGLLPDRCWGTYPSEYYDFNYDEGGVLSLDRKVIGTLTGLAFSAGKGLTQVGLWLTDWGYTWDAEDRLGFVSFDLSQRFEDGFVGPLALESVAWFVVIAWAGFTMLRGKLAVAGTEVALSVLLAVVASVFTANLSGYRVGAFETLNQLSDAVLAVGDTGQLPEDGPGTADILDDHLGNLHVAFVEEPYDNLNWGHSLGGYAIGEGDGERSEGGPCAEARDDIVARGPHGATDYPRQRMGDAGCDAETAFNSELPWDKVFAAVLYFGAALVMFLLLGMVSLTIILAKFGVIVLFALAPFAAVLAVLPGGGRRTAWRWLSSLLSVLALVVAMSFLLAILVVAVDGLLTETDVDMIERFLLLDVMVVGAVVARKRLMAGGQALANRLGDRLTAVTPAGAASWGGGGGGGSGGGRMPEAVATGIASGSVIRSANRLHERRARRVDSTRGNRRHGLWMMANGLTPRPEGWRPPSMGDRIVNRARMQVESSPTVRFFAAMANPRRLDNLQAFGSRVTMAERTAARVGRRFGRP